MSRARKSPFQLEGTLLSFSNIKAGRPRQLWLDCQGRQLCLKISKRLTLPSASLPAPGTRLLVQGVEKWDDTKCKRKVYSFCPLNPATSAQPQPEKTPMLCGAIQVCKKGNCWRRGGAALFNSLKRFLEEEGLSEQIHLGTTDCLKHCRNCPNLVCLPDGSVHGGLEPEDFPNLLRNHFTAPKTQK